MSAKRSVVHKAFTSRQASSEYVRFYSIRVLFRRSLMRHPIFWINFKFGSFNRRGTRYVRFR